MEERLLRYELGEIRRMHDEQHYKCVFKEYLSKQLKRMGLPTRVSRFELAEKVRELESKLPKFEKSF
ncbi:hypothetical protein HY450_02880 [Candidatus Pacearchaeota archaeon]|nr:hypothetical protein [Candidatus Pacearchaeota archaeon]